MHELNETYRRIQDGEPMRVVDWSRLKDAEECVHVLAILAEDRVVGRAIARTGILDTVRVAQRLVGRSTESPGG